MAKSKQISTSVNIAFKYATERRSKTFLIELLKRRGKGVGNAVTERELLNRLESVLDDKAKQELLSDDLLARRISASFFRIIDEDVDFPKTTSFTSATEIPQIVHIGKPGEIVGGLTYILWAAKASDVHFIDSELEPVESEQAVVIDSFLDEERKILQVRTGTGLAKKISKAWAEILDISFDSDLAKVGLTTVEEAEQFADELGGAIVACKGRRIEGDAFDEVSAKKVAGVDDLRGSVDYATFCETTDALSRDIQFRFHDKPFKISLGLDSQSIVFRTNCSESVIAHVYQTLMTFRNL